MSEERKQELLDEIKEALAEVPDAHKRKVVQATIHDIGVTARAIQIVESRSA